jgi:hypothetical protein
MDDHRIHPETLASDPFYAAFLDDDESLHACVDGWVFVGYIGDDGEEHEISYRCRRCAEDDA